MRSGELDRTIVIQAKTSTPDSYGQPIETWAKIHPTDSISAGVTPANGLSYGNSENFNFDQRVGYMTNVFRIRYLEGVTDLNRILYNSRVFDIIQVNEVGRREGLLITASARAE